jgi:SAM-dependent methyltransferase
VPGADHITWLHHRSQPSRWGNLGLWQRGAKPHYAEACRALAHAVGKAAHMRQGDLVLSLACGAGEELALWAETFGVASVMALEVSPSLAAQARQRAEAVHSGCPIDIYCADARRLALQVAGRFDRIVCVDAMYHLGERAPLHRAARTLLAPGGGYAYTDLVLEGPAGSWRRGLLQLGAPLAGIAAGEIGSSESGLQRLRDAGFDEVQVTRLDEAVLDGFCAYARWQSRRLPWAASWSAGWRRVAATAWLIRTGRAAGLGYALYSGRVNAAPDDETSTRRAEGAGLDLASEIARAMTSAERTALSNKGMPG